MLIPSCPAFLKSRDAAALSSRARGRMGRVAESLTFILGGEKPPFFERWLSGSRLWQVGVTLRASALE